MVSFTGSYLYYLDLQEDGQLVVTHKIGAATTTVVGDNDDFFRADEMVRITQHYNDLHGALRKTFGFTDDGILYAELDEGAEELSYIYGLATTNADYEIGQTISYHTEPSLPESAPPCFVNGTLIETDRGPVPVESLAVGDRVMGSSGLRTVKWIGWRNYHARSLRTPHQR